MIGRRWIEQVATRARSFEFFALVDLLARLLPRSEDAAAADPPIAFRASIDLAHAPSDVHSLELERDAAGRAVSVSVTANVLGLVGAGSPLPEHVSERTLQSDDEAGLVRQFFDVLHDRALSLLVDTWRAQRALGEVSLRREAPDLHTRALTFGGSDAFARRRRGQVQPSELAVADHRRGQRASIDLDTAERLLRMLLPRVALRLEGTRERRLPIVPSERARLTKGRARLGRLAWGLEVIDPSGMVRVTIGPLDRETFEAMLPGGAQYVLVRNVVTEVLGPSQDVELELILRADEAPRCTIGRLGAARLGVDARVTRRPQADLRARVMLTDSAGAATVRYVDHF